MDEAQQTLLRAHLAEVYVPGLPPLVQPSTVADLNEQKNVARALSAFVMHRICGATVEAACKSVVDDFADNGIDGIYYHPDNRTLYLIQSKLKASAAFTEEEAVLFCRGIRKLVTCDFSGFNKNVTDRTVEIEDALNNCEHIEIVVAHLGDALKQYPVQAIKELIADDTHGEVRLVATPRDVTADKLLAALQGVHAHQQVNCRLPLFDWASIAGSRKAYTAFAKVADLASLHQLHGRALYAQNIRASLGHQTDVNIAIANTLGKQPEDFAFFNNGVTILCRNVEPLGGSRDEKNFKLTGVSIVNGAQTVASAAHVISTSQPAHIDKARVLVTVIVADQDGDFGRAVTRSRNHQNAVRTADFAALDPQQERIRCELGLLGVRYAYQAETYDRTEPSVIRFDEAAYALAMLLPDPRIPVMAKRSAPGLVTVGEYPYSQIFNPALTAYAVRNAVEVHNYIIARMDQEAQGAADQLERLTYRHGGYVLAFVLMKKLTTAITGQNNIDPSKLANELGPQLDEIRQKLLDNVRPLAAIIGPLGVFRSQAHVNDIIRVIMTDNFGLKDDKAVPPLMAMDTSKEAYPERLFQYLASKAPQIGKVI